jgi:hypothetical protein
VGERKGWGPPVGARGHGSTGRMVVLLGDVALTHFLGVEILLPPFLFILPPSRFDMRITV